MATDKSLNSLFILLLIILGAILSRNFKNNDYLQAKSIYETSAQSLKTITRSYNLYDSKPICINSFVNNTSSSWFVFAYERSSIPIIKKIGFSDSDCNNPLSQLYLLNNDGCSLLFMTLSKNKNQISDSNTLIKTDTQWIISSFENYCEFLHVKSNFYFTYDFNYGALSLLKKR